MPALHPCQRGSGIVPINLATRRRSPAKRAQNRLRASTQRLFHIDAIARFCVCLRRTPDEQGVIGTGETRHGGNQAIEWLSCARARRANGSDLTLEQPDGQRMVIWPQISQQRLGDGGAPCGVLLARRWGIIASGWAFSRTQA